MRLPPFSRDAHNRKATTRLCSPSRSLCWCLYIAILACIALAVSASSTPSATSGPSLQYDPLKIEDVAYHPSIPWRSSQQEQPGHHDLHRRHPRPTPAPLPRPNPAPTVTVTQDNGGGVVVPPDPQDTTVTETAEVTTTIYDSNLPTTGTLTVIATTTVTAGGGNNGAEGAAGGSVTTTTTTTSEPVRSGTVTRTRTAVIETRLPQETQVWTPADIPRFAECLPGDEDYEEPGTLSLTREQKPTLVALAIMFVVILIGWNFVLIRDALYPLKVRKNPDGTMVSEGSEYSH